MSLIGDLFSSINPLASEEERDKRQKNISDRFDAMFGSEQNRAQTKLDALSVAGKGLGYDFSVNNLEHYRLATGEPLTVSRKQLGKYDTVLNAERKNQDRLIEAVKHHGKLKRVNGENVSLDDIKDNERVKLDDYYDVDNRTGDDFRNRDSDLGFGLGSFKLRSQSNLNFVKSGNKLLPYGYVLHGIDDMYDFNKDYPYASELYKLEKDGLAKPYKIKSQWKSYPVGVIDIKDGRLDASGLEWTLSEQ